MAGRAVVVLGGGVGGEGRSAQRPMAAVARGQVSHLLTTLVGYLLCDPGVELLDILHGDKSLLQPRWLFRERGSGRAASRFRDL